MNFNSISYQQTSKLEEPSEEILPKDEWANYLTHGLAFLLSLLGLFFIIKTPLEIGDYLRLSILGSYAFTLIFMYGSSTLYHYTKNLQQRRRFRILDHCAIYLFIAGSYTPFTLIAMKDEGGLTLFTLIWSMAFFGIFFKIFFIHRFKIISVLFYLTMGWLVLFSIQTLAERLSSQGLYLLVAGGLFYTCGIFFYVLDKRRFFHAIWHLFTIFGSACHYLCIFFYL